MFSGLMVNTWIAASLVALVAGVVGFFTVLRGSSFVAHAVPQCGFAGAAGASLLGINTVLGLGVFAVLSALGIGWLGRRGRHDAVTALALVAMLGLGALFLSFSVEYEPEIDRLLFGQVEAVTAGELLPTVLLALVALVAIGALYRPLMLTSVMAELGEARGVHSARVEACFLVVVALVTTLSVPVVGALLVFSLMVGPPGAARLFTDRPLRALGLSVGMALVAVWTAVAAAYASNWPVGFFVGALGAAYYLAGRGWVWWRRTGTPGPAGG